MPRQWCEYPCRGCGLWFLKQWRWNQSASDAGSEIAMGRALAAAGMTADDIDYINAMQPVPIRAICMRQ